MTIPAPEPVVLTVADAMRAGEETYAAMAADLPEHIAQRSGALLRDAGLTPDRKQGAA